MLLTATCALTVSNHRPDRALPRVRQEGALPLGRVRPGVPRVRDLLRGDIKLPWGEGPAPFELTEKIGCPVLGLFGEENPSPDGVAKIHAMSSNVSGRRTSSRATLGRARVPRTTGVPAIGRSLPPTRGSAARTGSRSTWRSCEGYASERRRSVSVSGESSRSSRLSRIWPGARSRGTGLKPSF